MGVSKGGNSGNQSGTTSGNTAYNSSGTSQSNTTGSNTTNATNSQTGGFNTSVVAPDGYQASWQGSQPTTLGDQANNYFSNQTNRNSYTLGSLADKAAAGVPGYSSYAAPTPVSAGAVQSGTGASFMDNYTQPWQAVTDSALGAYDVGAAKTIGAFKGANAPFGGSDRINSLGTAALTNEIGAGRGALAGNLLGQGYTTAANLGQQDASRAAGVDTGNADRDLNASQFNNTMTNQRQQADVQNAYQGDALRDSAATSQLNAETTGNNANNAWLQLGQGLFGQQGTNTMDSISNSISNLLGSSTGSTTESGSGTSNGTSTGSSNSKGGGLSLG